MKRLVKVNGEYEYGPLDIPRRQSRQYRLLTAMRRLSRNRWLTASETRRIGIALARCCSYRPWQTLEAAIGPTALYGVGLADGRSAVWLDDPNYRNILEFSKQVETFESLAAELVKTKEITK